MSTITRIKCKTDNCYLISEGRNAILVDTSNGPARDMVTAECDKYDLKLIVLTHTHFDHAENAAFLSKRYGVPVAFHKADDELFENYDKQTLKCYGLTGRIVLKNTVTGLLKKFKNGLSQRKLTHAAAQ